jgi:GntR family transcriptional regulator, colanic acid and biofilm gene transcriptional regulator
MSVELMDAGSLSQRAYQHLREELIAGNFRPGQRFIMQDLADSVGTSITPVREACIRLVSEGGLELRSRRFVHVPDLSLARYTEVRTIRIALEGLAAELAASRATTADVETLIKLNKKFATAVTSSKAEVAIRANRAFHFSLYRIAGLDMLTKQIESLWTSMGPILNVFYNDVATDYLGDEHLQVIAALSKADGAAARVALQRDILKSSPSLCIYLEQHEVRKSTF